MMQDYQQELGQIKNLLRQNPEGMSVTDIAKALKKNKNTTGRYLDILLISGQVDMRTYGMAKVFTLSQRVPLSAMLSYSKDLIMVLDKESRITDINENFATLLRIARKDAIGKNVAYLNSPEVDVRDFIHTLSAPGTRESERIVSFAVKGSGERIFKQKSVPTVFDDGQRGLTIILSDVTEEIVKEREIREREEQFRMMAENIQDGLIILENDRCTFVNRRVAEITGYTFEELWAMDPMATIIDPEDQKKLEPILELRKKPAQGVTEFQGRIRRKDGVFRDVYLRTTSLKHEETWFAFVIMTDITELRTKDAALFESEQRFRMMAENIQDSLFIIENEQLVYSNRRLSEITGYSGEELLAKSPRDLIAPEDMQRIEELYTKSVAGAGPAQFRSWVRCKNGESRFVYGHINSVSSGQTVSTYITMTDITEFAQREQALQDRIRELEKSIGQ
ncbi:putative PAS/PAC sensor protein [Methanoregula boonei 6A8]|jgi:PAS domain S-box-containing protein|uniref:Putative PAS/PAC sensor protein n=1 Tax=Methanoregula boonei (strain DSM 21154 / JCM 14090 / 6A8) TaxID=456442 RepID=A7I764_METB6|nr:PAS domain-containing protein [Methanoregula boonei]ABS55575.1 putative PAS/PAC sensor protein [Methanoregula boonei 6A8]